MIREIIILFSTATVIGILIALTYFLPRKYFGLDKRNYPKTNSEEKDRMEGCGKEFTYDGDGNEYICGEEFDYDTGENVGCGYLLCQECRKTNTKELSDMSHSKSDGYVSSISPKSKQDTSTNNEVKEDG